jgi:hypothetical protein
MNRRKEPAMPTIEQTDKPQPLPRTPESLPHGLIVPPPEVREAIERERANHPSDTFARAEEHLVNEWTLDHYFEPLMHEVLYRPTPEGPEVLAVGFEEIKSRTDGMKPEKMEGLKVWSPS